MKLNIKNILLYVVFLIAGIFLFMHIYKDFDRQEITSLLKMVDYRWLSLSLVISLFSHYLRALRWNLLIEPLGYKPAIKNTFMAVLVLYGVNIIVPRAGEVARCGVLKQYEKVPFTSLVGTVLIERIADVIVLGFISVYVLIAYYADILQFFNVNEMKSLEDIAITKILLLIVAVILLGVFMYWLMNKNQKIKAKIDELKENFVSGIKTIGQLKKRGLFVFYSIGIYVVYLAMLYFIFFAYPPTSHLTLGVGLFTFFMSALAMLAPIQAGIGAWHFMVIQALGIYGIGESAAKDFALLAHTSTNMVYLVIGLIAYLLLPLLNRNKFKA